ncbi:MAG TPA: DUF6152 family protein [Vicinamibacterales bacterium]|nr:DUF6152 family protein [Vicinamibacterales bacterium]
MTTVIRAVFVVTLLTVPLLVERADAHHGAGRFDPRQKVELQGKVTRVDFVNPHTYVYFDVVGDDGKVIAMKCETRGATVLRRSGWSPEMFVRGASIKVTGSPHRDDPTACTVDTMTLGTAPTLERYQQLSDAKSVNRAKRPFRLSNGKPNLAGDWAQEQQVLATPPPGRGRTGLVPISQAAAIRAGKVPMPAGPAGWFPPPVKLTAAGQAAADALRKRPTSENPRLSCQPTSILFDWVFDGAIGRITQSANVIKMEYGVGLTRTVHMNMKAHPPTIAPSRAGHSIGRWDGDTLVVDTVGFAPGTLAGSLPHSSKLHVIERFTLNPATLELTRDIVAEDPEYFVDKYVDSDSVLPADAPFKVEACKELAPEYQQTGRK